MDWVEIALVAVFAVLLVVEAVALVRGDRPITGAARTDARRWLIWPWGLGLLAAHFWSPWHSPDLAWLASAGAGLYVLALDVDRALDDGRAPAWAPFASLIVGLLCGLLWSRGY